MEDLGKYTRRTELYKLSAEEQTEKMKLVMKEVEKISAYTGVSEEAAYNLFLNGYDNNPCTNLRPTKSLGGPGIGKSMAIGDLE